MIPWGGAKERCRRTFDGIQLFSRFFLCIFNTVTRSYIEAKQGLWLPRDPRFHRHGRLPFVEIVISTRNGGALLAHLVPADHACLPAIGGRVFARNVARSNVILQTRRS